MSPVQKPALLRQAFGMASSHPAEIMSYQKMIGQLTDGGNTTTLAHYLQLLAGAFLLSPLSRWSRNQLRQRGSIPKIVMRDNALVTSLRFHEAFDSALNPVLRGRLVENAVGATLASSAESEGWNLFYWRDRQYEVDCIIQSGDTLLAIEVKSGMGTIDLEGMRMFQHRHPQAKLLVVGSDQPQAGMTCVSLRDFFLEPVKNVEIVSRRFCRESRFSPFIPTPSTLFPLGRRRSS